MRGVMVMRGGVRRHERGGDNERDGGVMRGCVSNERVCL